MKSTCILNPITYKNTNLHSIIGKLLLKFAKICDVCGNTTMCFDTYFHVINCLGYFIFNPLKPQPI
jgi:hypothetical protein